MNEGKACQINGGDKTALRDYLAANAKAVFNHAYSMLGDRGKAMEVVQSVFKEVKTRAEQSACPENLDEWVAYLTQEESRRVLEKVNEAEISAGRKDASDIAKDGGECQSDVKEKAVETGQVKAEPDVQETESETDGEKKHSRLRGFMDTAVIVILAALTLAAIWVLLVMLMKRGILPDWDMGFADWFNENIFNLF
ncbi:MAG: hypothetical protein ACLVML_04515 [Candidatus Gastranaerophilaceae bacterium]|jgi:DNA-directed RNA polymerase specialized sigma24 family protein|nr:hypothetical protein [Christensenellales bacterium]